MDRPLLDHIREVGEEVKSWPVWMRRLMGIDTRSGNERRVIDEEKYDKDTHGDFNDILDAGYEIHINRRKEERRG